MNMSLAGDMPLLSFYNTSSVVLLAFLIFVGALIYFGVPKRIIQLLDDRAEVIRLELAEAKRLREEAQEMHAEYERRLKEVSGEAEEIVKLAKANAEAAAEEAKRKLALQIERRIAAGQEQIASSEAAVTARVRSEATNAAIAATSTILKANFQSSGGNDAIDEAIAQFEKQLN